MKTLVITSEAPWRRLAGPEQEGQRFSLVPPYLLRRFDTSLARAIRSFAVMRWLSALGLQRSGASRRRMRLALAHASFALPPLRLAAGDAQRVSGGSYEPLAALLTTAARADLLKQSGR